jgi:hypothetical protein
MAFDQKPNPNLAAGLLKPGDILMHHAHAGGQWQRNPFHCSIVGSDGEVWDSLPQDGVRWKKLSVFVDEAVVIRPVPDAATTNIPAAAAKKAAAMKDVTGYGDKVLGTDKWRAATSVLGSHTFDAGAAKRLNKYHTVRLPKNVFCSEYVILCYQLACKENGLDQHAALFPNRDARYTIPSDLEAYLQKYNAHWHVEGEFP